MLLLLCEFCMNCTPDLPNMLFFWQFLCPTLGLDVSRFVCLTNSLNIFDYVIGHSLLPVSCALFGSVTPVSLCFLKLFLHSKCMALTLSMSFSLSFRSDLDVSVTVNGNNLHGYNISSPPARIRYHEAVSTLFCKPSSVSDFPYLTCVDSHKACTLSTSLLTPEVSCLVLSFPIPIVHYTIQFLLCIIIVIVFDNGFNAHTRLSPN